MPMLIPHEAHSDSPKDYNELGHLWNFLYIPHEIEYCLHHSDLKRNEEMKKDEARNNVEGQTKDVPDSAPPIKGLQDFTANPGP